MPGAPHPIGPSSSPLRPFGRVWLLSRCCTSWGLQEARPARCGWLRKNRSDQSLMMGYAEPTQCALGALLPPVYRADSAHARLPPMHCVKARPIQRHVIACAALACRRPARAKLSSLSALTYRPAQRRSAPPRSRCIVPSFHPRTSQAPLGASRRTSSSMYIYIRISRHR